MHISDALKAKGHNVFHVDPIMDVRLSPISIPQSLVPRRIGQIRNLVLRETIATKWYARKLREVAVRRCDKSCDLVLSTHDFLSPVVQDQLKRALGAQHALWFPDAISRFGKSFMLSGDYDFLFFKDPLVARRLRDEVGVPAHYLPECCNPLLHTLPESAEVDEVFDLGTAGNFHPARARALRKLSDAGYSLGVWGPPVAWWMKPLAKGIDVRPFVVGHDKARAFRSCRIVLNNVHPTEVDGTNVRTFEIAASGAFQIATYRPALDALFDTGTQLVTYQTLDELVEKSEFYLKRPDLRREIADQARERVLCDHTYSRRIDQMMSAMGLQPQERRPRRNSRKKESMLS